MGRTPRAGSHPPSDRCCYCCGGTGHIASVCPSKGKGKASEKTDTGKAGPSSNGASSPSTKKVWKNKSGKHNSTAAAALKQSVADGKAQAQAVTDINRDAEDEIAEALETNVELTEQVEALEIERDALKAKEDARAAQLKHKHQKWIEKFDVSWTEDAEDGDLWNIFLFGILPNIVLLAGVIYAGFVTIDTCHYWLLFSGLYQLLIFYVDRRDCLENGRSPYFFATPRTHKYKFDSIVGFEHAECRPHVWKTVENEYEALYVKVTYAVEQHHSNVMSDEEKMYQDKRWISVELLEQLAGDPRNMPLVADELTVLTRLENCARAFKCVNISKELVLKEDVLGNTVMVALGIWKRNQQRRFGYFPSPPAN
jgi:hypothetical protein